MENSTEVTVGTNSTAVETNTVFDNLPAWLGGKARGEGASDSSDVTVPWLRLVQSMTEEAQAGVAKQGDIYLRAQMRVIPRPFEVIVLAWDKFCEQWSGEQGAKAPEWRLHWADMSDEQKAATQFRDNPRGGPKLPPLVQEVRRFVIVEYDPKSGMVDPHGIGPMVFNFKKTSSKGGAQLGAALTALTQNRPIYSRSYRWNTEETQNKAGQRFARMTVAGGNDVPENYFQALSYARNYVIASGALNLSMYTEEE